MVIVLLFNEWENIDNDDDDDIDDDESGLNVDFTFML